MSEHRCPFFGRCGGCRFDFSASDYRESKASVLPRFSVPSSAPIWGAVGERRRADFAFSGGRFGFFERGSKNIVQIDCCPNLTPEINSILPVISKLPWPGSGSCLITLCDNGIDICITSNVAYCSPEFRAASLKIPAIRISWNGRILHQTTAPVVNFAGHSVEYPIGAFLQPSIHGADALRNLVVTHASGCGRIADLFCGLGNFTFALNADGFDIVGTGVRRDLFKHPLTPGMLNQYDCVVMDPPRAGASAQCHELVKSNVPRIIYISCNPQTFLTDSDILRHGGYRISELIPVDQFVGSHHWEIFSVFEK